MPTLDIFGIVPILHRRVFQRTDLYSVNIRHQLHPRFLPPIHLLLQTARKLVFTAGLLDLLLSPGRGRLGCFPFAVCCVSLKEPCDSSVSYLLVDYTPHFFSNFALYGEMFDLRWTRSRRSNVTCSLFSNWRLAAFTVVPVEAVCVAKWMVLVHETRQWENRRWNCRSIGRIGFVSFKITELCGLRGWLYVTTHSWFMWTLQNLPIRGTA